MRSTFIFAILPLALASPLVGRSSPAEDDAAAQLAPLSATDGAEHIEDSYIVVFKKDVNVDQIALHLSVVDEWHGLSVSPMIRVISSPIDILSSCSRDTRLTCSRPTLPTMATRWI